MKSIITLAVTGLAALALASPVLAADPPPAQPVTPFPSVHSGGVFVIAQTVQGDGAINGYYAPGSTVSFRAYAVDGKTRKILTGKMVKYFYITVPSQPNVKMSYTPTSTLASGRYRWTGTWTVPADYPIGIVSFKMLVKADAKRAGSFVQLPVATSQLTISTKPPAVPGSGPGALPAPGGSTVALGLYADTVNGSRPSGAAARPIGCTQTNIYKRGEQIVVRSWGFDLTSGSILTMDNVIDAHFTVPGQPNVVLNWGAHGVVGTKVWFWANAWNIPADYPLGNVTVRVSFTTDTDKTGTLDYPVTIIP